MEDIRAVKLPPPAPGLVRVRDTKEVLEFQGELVTDSSSDDRSQPRWTELVLYRLTDGTQRYVLQVIGRSTVYHAADGCERGVPVPLADLADRYLDEACTEPIPEPCEVCRPRDVEAVEPNDETVVKMEVDWYSAYECQNVDELLQRLRLTKGRSMGQFSMPALLLLDRAKSVDPTVAIALTQVRRL
jgi:hypothetical protein